MKVALRDARYGDVILFRPTSALGDVIAHEDGGVYSHGALYHVKLDGRHAFTESLVSGGVVLSVLDESLMSDGVVNFDVYRPPFPIARTRREVMERVGRVRYDLWKLVRIFLHNRFGVPLPRVGNSLADICTEHINWAYGGAFGPLATPRTIHEAVR